MLVGSITTSVNSALRRYLRSANAASPVWVMRTGVAEVTNRLLQGGVNCGNEQRITTRRRVAEVLRNGGAVASCLALMEVHLNSGGSRAIIGSVMALMLASFFTTSANAAGTWLECKWDEHSERTDHTDYLALGQQDEILFFDAATAAVSLFNQSDHKLSPIEGAKVDAGVISWPIGPLKKSEFTQIVHGVTTYFYNMPFSLSIDRRTGALTGLAYGGWKSEDGAHMEDTISAQGSCQKIPRPENMF